MNTATHIAKPLTHETWRVQDHSNRLWVERERSRGWLAAKSGREPDGLNEALESLPYWDGVHAYCRKFGKGAGA